jgi:hypothetical protein
LGKPATTDEQFSSVRAGVVFAIRGIGIMGAPQYPPRFTEPPDADDDDPPQPDPPDLTTSSP